MSMSIKSGGSYQLDPVTGEVELIENTTPDGDQGEVAPAIEPDAPDTTPTAEQAAAAELDGPVLTDNEPTTTTTTEEPQQ